MLSIEIESANPKATQSFSKLTKFSSYNFDRNILTPASAFRFTAPDVDKKVRLNIRSGDQITLIANPDDGDSVGIATGFIDETDTHITPQSVEYVITGRDTIGQLVDNDAVDGQNKIILYDAVNLKVLVNALLSNTRMAGSYRSKQLDANFKFSVATNLGETKINVLQRYLEYVNGLVWSDHDGVAIIDKPNFSQDPIGVLAINYSNPAQNNVLEARVRRNINQAIREIVVQQDGTEAASNTYEVLKNMDPSIVPYRGSRVGRSVSELFSYARGYEILNQQQGVGNGSLSKASLSRSYAARAVARENMRVLDVEIVVEGHFNAAGTIYDIDQIYEVQIEDEDVGEPMYVYAVSYEMTIAHGMLTRLRLCRKFTICAYTQMLDSVVSR